MASDVTQFFKNREAMLKLNRDGFFTWNNAAHKYEPAIGMIPQKNKKTMILTTTQQAVSKSDLSSSEGHSFPAYKQIPLHCETCICDVAS